MQLTKLILSWSFLANDKISHVRFILLKLFIFKGIVWNSLVLIMFLGVIILHARFIFC